MRGILLLALAVAAAAASTSPDNSGGFSQIWLVQLPDQAAVNALRRLEETAIVRQVKQGVVGGRASIAVTRENAAAVGAVLERAGLEWEVAVGDFAAAAQQEMAGILGRRKVFEATKADWLAGVPFDLDNYHTFDEIMMYLEDLASE